MDMGFEKATKTGASSSVNVRVLKQCEAEMMMMLPSLTPVLGFPYSWEDHGQGV